MAAAAKTAGAVGVQSVQSVAPAIVPTCGGCHHHHHHNHHHHCWESWRCDPYGGIDPYWGGGDCGCDGWYDPYNAYAWDTGLWGGGFDGFDGFDGLGGFGGFGGFGHHRF